MSSIQSIRAAVEEIRQALLQRRGVLRDRDEAESVQRALGKIAAGTYGWCECCRVLIPLSRLKAAPETRYCLDCERLLEAAASAPARSCVPALHRPVPTEAGLVARAVSGDAPQESASNAASRREE